MPLGASHCVRETGTGHSRPAGAQRGCPGRGAAWKSKVHTVRVNIKCGVRRDRLVLEEQVTKDLGRPACRCTLRAGIFRRVALDMGRVGHDFPPGQFSQGLP